MTKFRSVLIKTHLALSLVPWVTLLVNVAYSVTGWFSMGRWPRYFDPEEWSAPFPLGWVWERIEYVILLGLPAWVLVLVFRLATRSRQGLWRTVLIFILGWLAFLIAANFQCTVNG